MANIGTDPKFTTTEAVRGALGVDDTDLPDQTILSSDLDVELALDLSSWLVSWKTKIDPATPATEDQLLLQKAIQTYCKWWCAAEYANRVLAHIQLYGDGKAEMRRFTNFEWEALIAYCSGKAGYYKDMVLELDPESESPTAEAYGLISGGIPTHDPVTNEGAR